MSTLDVLDEENLSKQNMKINKQKNINETVKMNSFYVLLFQSVNTGLL